jgi:hypothetical protein
MTGINNLLGRGSRKPLESASWLAVVILLVASPQANCAAAKKTAAAKPAPAFDLKRITAAAAGAAPVPKKPLLTAATTPPGARALGQQKNTAVAVKADSHPLTDTERQFQFLKKTGFKGNPPIELLQRLAGEMHNQHRWTDKELLMKANVAAYEKRYGHDHPVVAAQIEPIIDMYKKQNKMQDASKWQERLNAILKTARENIDATPLFEVSPDGTTTEKSPMTYQDRLTDLRARADVFANHADYSTSAAYLKKALAESKEEDDGGSFSSEDYKNLADYEERLGHDKEAAKLRGEAESKNQ